jgi:hypothetical protein
LEPNGLLTQRLQLVTEKIGRLVAEFQACPWEYFHEKDLHSRFAGLCHGAFGSAKPTDRDFEVDLFRQEYDTVWRYYRAGEKAFAERYAREGTTAALDFAVLSPEFVRTHEWLTVVNKDENRRASLRRANAPNPAIDIGIEFKMIHFRTTDFVQESDVTTLRKGMLEDCRKLRLEAMPFAFLIGFSHGIRPSVAEVAQIEAACQEEYAQYNGSGSLRVMVAVSGIPGTLQRSEAAGKTERQEKVERVWYYYSEGGKRYYLVLVNARRSCSLRGFDAESGKLSMKRTVPGHAFQEVFSQYIDPKMRLDLPVRVNLEDVSAAGLPEPLFRQLQQEASRL